MFAKKIALAFGIALVFPMLIHYGVSTFVPPPKPLQFGPVQLRGTHPEYKTAEKRFEQYLFAVAVPAGLVALLVGAYLRRPAIGTGLMVGGIFTILDGYFNYWSQLADALKFASLLAAFGLLVFLSYRRLERTAGGDEDI